MPVCSGRRERSRSIERGRALRHRRAMRSRLTALAVLALAGCTGPTPGAGEVGFWTPQPVGGATEPSVVVKDAPASDWRPVAPENLLLMDLADGARVAIELAPDFAPVHVANIRALARAGWWNGAKVYRVQDNYVAQWGVNEAPTPLPSGVVKAPPAEYTRPLAALAPRALAFPDSYAARTGHADGWPIAWNPASGEAWLTHCYATVGVGRDLAPDTGTGGELYAVIGHAPRHLDRNIAVVGRVIDGIDALAARPRGREALGFIKDEANQAGIARVRLAADVPAAERPRYEVMRTDSSSFDSYVAGRANRGGTFFNLPAGGVDLCNVQVPVRKAG